jgi:hypothetical protein
MSIPIPVRVLLLRRRGLVAFVWLSLGIGLASASLRSSATNGARNSSTRHSACNGAPPYK